MKHRAWGLHGWHHWHAEVLPEGWPGAGELEGEGVGAKHQLTGKAICLSEGLLVLPFHEGKLDEHLIFQPACTIGGSGTEGDWRTVGPSTQNQGSVVWAGKRRLNVGACRSVVYTLFKHGWPSPAAWSFAKPEAPKAGPTRRAVVTEAH